MTITPACPLRTNLLRCLRVFSLFLAVATCAIAADAAKKSFDLPADTAEASLKRFAAQSGLQVVYASELTDGVRANAVKGEFTPLQAAGLLLDGTRLRAILDDKTGILSVIHEPKSDPNARRMALEKISDHPQAEANSEGTQRMEAVQVESSKISGLNNTTLFRTDKDAPLHYDVISREEIDRMGATNMQEIFRYIPQVTSYGFSTQANASVSGFVGGDTIRGDSVAMRGFADTSTVVLVNGRVITGPFALPATLGADIGKIPPSMIDRIEILPASAAALYGGGALAGVINIILRKDYNVRDLTMYYGTSTEGGGSAYRLTYLQGFTFDNGNSSLMITVDYDHRNAVKGYQRGYLNRLLAKFPPTTKIVVPSSQKSAFENYVLPAFSGMPGTIETGTNPNVTTGAPTSLLIPSNTAARYAGVPAGLTDAQAQALTPASFNATAGTANLGLGGDGSRFGQANLYTPDETYGWDTTFEHVFIPDRLSMFAEFTGTHSVLDQFYQESLSFTMAANFPLNPFRTNVTPGFPGVPVFFYFSDPDIPLGRTLQVRDNAKMVLGLKGKWASTWEWSLDLSGDYTRNFFQSFTPDAFYQQILLRPGPGDPGYTNTPVYSGGPNSPTTTISQRWTSIYDPLADHNLYPIPLSTVNNYFSYANDSLRVDYVKLLTLEGRATGHVYELPAGPIVASPGFALSAESESNYQTSFYPTALSDPAVFGNSPSGMNNPFLSKPSMSIRGAFIEVTAPVIGKKFRPIPGIYSAEIDGSYRDDRANHARAAETHTVSGKLALSPSVYFRASLTEGYTLLALSQTALPTTLTNVNTTNLVDPQRGNTPATVVIPTEYTGGNPGLKPQYARAKNFGVGIQPRGGWLEGFSWNLDYWEYKVFNGSGGVSLAAALATPQNYPGRVVRGPLTAADQALGYTGGPIVSADLTVINIAVVSTNGFDSKLNWHFSLPDPAWGTLNFVENMTWTNSYRVVNLPYGPKVNEVGAQTAPLKWKGYAQLFWEHGNVGMGITANYTDKYHASTTTPSALYPTGTGVDGAYIPSSTTFDFQLTYKIPYNALGGTGWRSWISGTKWTLGCLDILDTAPPEVTDGSGLYSRYGDPRQRYPYVQIEKTF